MKRLLACLVLLTAPATARAQLQFAGDAPRVLSVEPRQHSYHHEVQLGVGVLPLDAFFIGLAGTGSYTYHSSDLWAWEVVHGAYSYNVDTSLKSDLAKFGAQASVAELQENKLLLTTNVMFKPMAGKYAVFNHSVVQSETYFAAGIGTAMTNKNWYFAADLGVGFRFWLSQAASLRLDVRDYLVFRTLAPSNALMVVLSGSWSFGPVDWSATDLLGPG